MLRTVAIRRADQHARLWVALSSKYNSEADLQLQQAAMEQRGGRSMTDRYTKVALTVIAGALVVLVVRDAVRPSTAQSVFQICDNQHCVKLINAGTAGSPIWAVPVVSNR
jgi:hypothetical protein